MGRQLFALAFVLLVLPAGCGKSGGGTEEPPVEYSFNVSPESLLFIFKEGDYTFRITTDAAPWTVSSNAEWCVPQADSGSGDGQLVVHIYENPDYRERTALLVFKYGSTQQTTVRIEQTARPEPYIRTDPGSLEYFRPGGEILLRVSSNVQWEVAATGDWLSVDTPAAYQDQEIYVTASPLTGTVGRECELVFTGETATVSLRVVQSTVDPAMVAFADQKFKNYCVENWDLDGDGEISVFEAAQARHINVFDMGITSLAGIEHFTGLTEIACSQNRIGELDVSANSQLLNLWCDGASLTKLTLGGNPSLQRVYCSGNSLEEIDISGCPELLLLSADMNPLTAVDCSRNVKLTSLSLSETSVSSLDLSANPALHNISCSWTPLSRLDLSANPKTAIVNISGTGVTSMDLSGLPELFRFTCADCDFREIDVSVNPKLNFMDCTGNPDLSVIYVWQGFDPSKVGFLKPEGTRYEER